jgi:multiple sugar transport system permease protein
VSSPATGAPGRGKPLSDRAFAVLLTLPAVALFAGVIAYPLVASLVTGLYEQSLVLSGRTFVGLANLRDVIGAELLPVLRNTVVFAVAATAVPVVLGMALALSLNVGLRGSRVLRGVFLLPWVVPGVVASFLWLWIFDANYGVLNGFLVRLGLIEDNVVWLGQPGTAMLGVIIAKSWASFPWIMVMLLAGLQTVPSELHEAAAVDGAGTIRRFFAITIPHLRGVLAIVVLLELIWNFQHFDMIYVLTRGGPAGTTTTFALGVYDTAFKGFDLGRASALGACWMAILMVLVVVYLRFAERGERR